MVVDLRWLVIDEIGGVRAACNSKKFGLLYYLAYYGCSLSLVSIMYFGLLVVANKFCFNNLLILIV